MRRSGLFRSFIFSLSPACYRFGMTKKRVKGLEFHIAHDDFFGTLASVLFLQQELMGGALSYEEARKAMRRTTEDLVYLQDHFQIVAKERRHQQPIIPACSEESP
jgi:hypothetical protein